MKSFHTAVTSTIFLKASSLILGFLLWSSVSELFPRTIWVVIPVCFYHREARGISSPETVSVELTGKHSHIKRIDTKNLAVHIDARTLHTGDNHVTITADKLLLPPTISVATIIPNTIIIRIAEEKAS
jgi:hypothetical protein